MNRIEDFAQSLIEASLARILREKLQPGALLRALVRAIEDAEAADRAHPPTHFWLTLNDVDLGALRAAHPMLADDLAEQVRQIMLQMGLRLDATPRVMLHGAISVPTAQIRVNARWMPPEAERVDTGVMPAAQPAALPRQPFLIVDGRRQIDLTQERVVIGRARDNDIVVDDRRVSRKHLELRWLNASQRFLASDIGSSGGTHLNGHPIKQCTLEPGDVLSLGGYELIYGETFDFGSTVYNPPHAPAS
jgi:FHA domain/Protein of unknown function (DUF3662)